MFSYLKFGIQNIVEGFYTQENSVYKITRIPVLIGLGECP